MADDQFYSFERLTGLPNPNREPVQVEPKSKELSKEQAALKFITENYNSPNDDDRVISERAMKRMNLNENHLDAMRYANELEDSYFKQKGYVAKADPTDFRIVTSNKIKNKINDTIAETRPAIDVQGVSNVNRFFIKNLIDNDTELQQEYLNRQGFQTRVRDGEVEVKRPKDMRYSRIDPSDFDIADVTDVMGDVIEGAAQGVIGTAGLTAGGLPGAALGGAIGGAATEKLRQKLAMKMGLRKEFDNNLIGTSAALGTLTEFGIPAMGKLVRNWGAKDVATSGLLKKNAMEIASKIEGAGLEPMFVQLVDSQNYTNLFRKVVEGVQTPLNKEYYKSMSKAFDDAKVVIRGLVDGADFADTSVKGTALKEAFAQDFAKIFAPSQQLYNDSLDILKKTPYKYLEAAPTKNNDVIGSIKNKLVNHLESLKDNEEAAINNLEPVLDEFIKSAGKIESINGLKVFRTRVFETLKRREFPLSKGAKQFLNANVIPVVSDLRAESIDTLIRNYDLDSKSKFFDLLDDRLSGVKGYNEFNPLKEEILDSLDDLKEMAAKKGSTLYGVLKSDKAQILSDYLDEYIDALGTSPIAKTKEFKSLTNDYLDYMDTFAHISVAKQKLAQADELNKTAREGINALFSKTGVDDVLGEPKDIFKKYMKNLASDDFVKKIVDTRNLEKIEAVKRFYPDAFNKFKKAKLGDIFREVIDINNDVNITEFKKAIKKLSDGEKIALFGDEWATKVDGLESYLSTLPPKLNTSGTAIWYELMNWDKWYSPISEPFKIAKSGFEALRLKRIQGQIESGVSNREKMVNAISKRFKNTALGYEAREGIREGLMQNISPLLPTQDDSYGTK